MPFDTKKQADDFARFESAWTGVAHVSKKTFYYTMPSMEVRRCWTVTLDIF